MSAPSDDVTWSWLDAPEPEPPADGDPIWEGCWGWDPRDDDPVVPAPDRIVVAGALRQLSEAPDSVAAGLQTLAEFASLDRLGPAVCGPDGSPLSGADLVSAVQAAHRLVGWAQAQEQRLTAALARPGVAVPVCDVLETVLSGTTPIVPDPEGVQPSAADIADPTRGYRQTRVRGDATWDLAVVQTAASLAEPELAAALRLATITARTRIGAALDMVDGVPATLAAVEAGRIDPYAGRLIADATACLDAADLRAEAERQILVLADGRTPGDIGRIAADVVIHIDPEAAQRRAEQARARRGTGIRSLQDDLARFYADLACEDAVVAQQVLDQLAGALPPQARAGRGTNAIRADIFADMFTQLATVGHIDLRPEQPDPADDTPHDPPYEDYSAKDDPASDHPPHDNRPGPTDQPVAIDTLKPNPADPEPTDHAVTADPAPDRPERDGPMDPGASGPADVLGDPECTRRGGLLSQLRLPDPEPTDPSSPDHAVTADPAPDRPERDGPMDLPGEPGPADLLGDPECTRRGGLLSQLRLPDPLRVNLDITVGLSTLAGLDDLPATLAGYGAITAQLARALNRAAGSVRLRLVDDRSPGSEPTDTGPTDTGPAETRPTDNPSPANNGGRHRGGPDCGGPLDLGRSSYRPTAALERAVNQRDRRCRFLGCALPAERCDKDHAITWDSGGASCPCNLDCLCRFHHRVKTFTSWRAERHADNTVVWTSPLGSRYTDMPVPERSVRTVKARSSDTRAAAESPDPSDRQDAEIEPTVQDEPPRPARSSNESPPF